MAEEEVQQDFSKLDTEERLKHKNWKARISAYEELTKLFLNAESPEDAEFKKYASKVKDFVQDSHAAAQEKGLEAAVAFVDNASPPLAGKICGDVVAGILAKCLTASKIKTREKGIEIVMLYFELEKHEIALEELVKGLTNKSPKVVSACVAVIRDALRLFGSKYVSIKVVLKAIHPLLADRDKSVRDEAKALFVEIYRWIGEAIKPQLADLQPVQITELETEFAKLKGTKAVPEKLVRSEQARAAKARENPVATAEGDKGSVEEEPEEVKLEDLVEPVEVLKGLPDDFHEKLQSKKWLDRKEALELLDKLSDHPKLMEGDYNEVVSSLKKIIGKDSNVVVIALAGKCLTNLAKGIKQKFGPCAQSSVSVIIEKFKEKKAAVVTQMRDAIDACFLSLTLEAITEDLVEGLGHKTPSVKSETALFLNRCFCKCNPQDLPKKLLKVFMEALIKNTNDPDGSVRDSAFEAIGTALKVVGEKAMAPFVGELDELKMKKIKDFCDKAVITAKKPKPGPATAAAPKAETAKPADPKVVKKPVVRPGAKPAAAKPMAVEKTPSEPEDPSPDTPLEPEAPKKPGVAKGKVAPAKAKSAAAEDFGPNIVVVPKGKKQRENDEKLLKVLKWTFQTPTKEFVMQLKDQMTPCFSASMLTWMFSDDFKNHIKSIQGLQDDLAVNREPTITVLDLILKWFSLRFFDTNPQVLAKGLEYLQYLFKKLSDEPVYQLTEGESSCFVPFLLIKIGDPKDAVRKDIRHVVRQLCCLTAYTKIYGYLAEGMKSKNAKQRTECLDLATWTMETYGMDACVPNPQTALKLVAAQISDRDATARNAALNNLLCAYQLIGGDKLFKLIGQMNDKDRSMLEERIKRAPKKPSVPAPAEPAKPELAVKPVSRALKTAPPVVAQLEPPGVDDSGSDSGLSTNSKGSKGNGDSAPSAEKEDQPRPATVTLRRTAPALLPVSAQDFETVMFDVPIPKLSQSAKTATGIMSTLFSDLLDKRPELCLQALKKIDDMVSKSVVDPAVSSNLTELYRHLSEVLRKLYTSYMPNYATNFQYISACYGHVLHILRVLFDNPRHADQTNALVLSDLIHNLISLILDRRMESMNGGPDIVKNANVITLRIVDNANRTQIICASICLLRQLLGSGQITDKFLDLVIKCVWRCVRKMPETVLQLQVDPILLEVHLFLKQFPASHWQTAADDTPFRTVKTILYSLSRMYESDILSHLTLVEDPENSELMAYLKKVGKSMERNDGGDHGRPQSGESRQGPEINGSLKKHEETLSNIVQKVGSSDDKAVQQGLRELYEYKEAHGVNLDDFLERTSVDFQKFVKEGLRMIEFDQKDLGLPESGLSEKGQGIINRLKSVISSPFFTAQDIEQVKRMANDMKLEVRAGCFKTASQRVEASLKTCEAMAYKTENSGTARPPSLLSPSRAMRPADDNSPGGRSDNLDAVKARVKAYLQNKGT